jgi:hypothetical protein
MGVFLFSQIVVSIHAVIYDPGGEAKWLTTDDLAIALSLPIPDSPLYTHQYQLDILDGKR